ncbi:MAG: DUF1990 domain-containing protein [Bacteroidota bacterium]
MTIYMQKPPKAILDRFLEKEKTYSCTYPEQGASRLEQAEGYDNDQYSIHLGRGEHVWQRACEAVMNWEQFPNEWTEIYPATGVQDGGTVAVLIRLFGLWWLNSARIVYVIDEPNRCGFAYGTLPGHVEMGEEAFWVERNPEGEIFYHIRAFSKPRSWLTRLGYPIVRLCQKRFGRHSTRQMQALVRATPQKVQA